MNTPICDFVRSYAEKNALRLHMPGHKGVNILGVETLDITEVHGADSLYEAGGIIRESERNASELFGCETLYSTEGSSLCIRAMLYLALLHSKQQKRTPLVYAARNAHKTFMSAAALLDLDVEWICGDENASYLSCRIDADALDQHLANAENPPFALYITSPDYLGSMADVAALAAVCHRHDVLLLVDNAHGAYLRFLPDSLHPIDLGADMCCDSAHKTLPVLTGGAYLHIAPDAPTLFSAQAKNALALFGSTSPSYLILQSLDAANRILDSGFKRSLCAFTGKVSELRSRLKACGYRLMEDEPLKITIDAKAYGYSGYALDRILLDKNIVTEFADPDYIVMMLAPENGDLSLEMLEEALCSIPRKNAVTAPSAAFHSAERVLSIREASLSPNEIIPVEQSEGRILAAASVGCPPAVPIVICGERIDAHAVECFRYYGIEQISAVKES